MTRRRLRFAAVAVGVVAALFGTSWGLRWWHGPDRVRAELDASEPGWRLADMLAAHEAGLPPDEENPAVLAVRCREQVGPIYQSWLVNHKHERFSEAVRGDDRPPNVRPPRPAVDGLRRVTAENDTALQLARRAGRCDRPGGAAVTPPPAELEARLPHLEAVRTAAEVLADAVAVAVANGHPEEAVADLIALLRLARTAAADPLGQLWWERHVLHLAVVATEQTLARGVPVAGLDELEHQLHAGAAVARLPVAVRRMRASYDVACEAVRSGSLTAAEVKAFYRSHEPRAVEPPAWYHFNAAEADHKVLLRALTAAVGLAERPAHLRPPLTDAFADVPPGPRYRITRGLVETVGNMDEVDRQVLAWLRTAAAGVACERYRQAHGRWPAALTDLGPPPPDPHDGQPLRLARTPDGIVIYTVGPDRIDDGGRAGWYGQANTDIRFRLYDPAHRNRPHPEDGP